MILKILFLIAVIILGTGIFCYYIERKAKKDLKEKYYLLEEENKKPFT